MYASTSFSPSSREALVGCEAKPVANKTLYRKSPELSPVNMRPVRLAPWAPGASPIRTKRRARIAEAGHWFRPIIPIAIGAALDAPHFGAIRHQARAPLTTDNLALEDFERLQTTRLPETAVRMLPSRLPATSGPRWVWFE